MKKQLVCFLAGLFALMSGTAFVGCDLLLGTPNDEDSSSGGIPKIDNVLDLKEYMPTPDDDNEYLEGEKYYTSTSTDLVTEVNGNYSIDRPFTLDKENENKRIYSNIYFYEDDFFQVIYYKNINALGSIYAIMSDAADEEYAEVEYTSKGTPLQINIKQQGIYNLILDIETFEIDMVKVGDIDTPVYETIRSCELKVQVSSNFTYSQMTLNEETNEYYIEKDIPLNASIGFYSESHNSCYKTTVESSIGDTLVYWSNTSPSQITVHVGGRYKVYFNAKTYVLRLELQNPDTANYYCQVEWNKGNELTAVSSETPYLFAYTFVAQGTASSPYVDIPSFYPMLGMSYDLSVIDVDGYVAYDEYIKESGTYKLTVNLKDFTLTVEKV